MDAGGANGAGAASSGMLVAPSSALAIVGAPQPKPQEKTVSLTTTKAIDEMHGDEISRRLAEFAKAGPKGLYSKPRGK